ncbi:CBS domain-containing protein [Thiohalorhabdus methylotrophus]|uniref:CBS domain-containing protein n=1 Tax=Thiohalorhabdus methylotrophus TaxID=3242694 RepID=A0ABV4TQS5_9GAMM
MATEEGGWPPLELELTESDIQAAMGSIPAYIDITSSDFREIYHLAFRHAVERLAGAMKARDVIARSVVTVQRDTPLPEVTALMVKHRISGLPVVDESGRVAGIISEHDFVTHAREEDGRTVIEILPAAGVVDEAGSAAHGYAHVAEDIMTPQVVTLEEDAPLPEIAARFAEWTVNRLPVVDHQDRLIGLVSRWDLVQSVLTAFRAGADTS